MASSCSGEKVGIIHCRGATGLRLISTSWPADIRRSTSPPSKRDSSRRLVWSEPQVRPSSQRGALIAANRQIDERRRFTETVLAGVSAGVIGVDGDGHAGNQSG